MMMRLESRADTLEGVGTDLFLFLEHEFDEAQCNLNHDLIPGLPCTVVIAASGTYCRGQVNLCAMGAAFARAYMERHLPCPFCDRRAEECWRVIDQ